MEAGTYKKMGAKHVASTSGFEVKWDVPEAIAYIEPPRRMEFSVEGYWGRHGTWQYDILTPDQFRWWAPHQHETLTPEQVDRIKTNLIHALNFLFPGELFELVAG